mgnify:CR=1 FL=1
MILNTGNRTDIPAFYTPWFMNRVKSGEVLVRSPYAENQVTRYRLDPSVVDLLVFCTKNPYPILPHLKSLSIFDTFWHVTITPYGRDIEPNVPSKRDILSAFQYLSHQIGANRIVWRYDPILINHTYTTAYHIEAFRSMAETLQGYTHQVVISFIDLYEKTKRNFPEARPVSAHDQVLLVNAFSEIAKKTGLAIHLCCESAILERDNVDANGCPRLSSKKLLVKNFPYHAAKHRGKAVPVFLEPISALIIHALISAAIAMPITMKPW